MQVALLLRASSIGWVLDSCVASVCVFWERQGSQMAVISVKILSDVYIRNQIPSMPFFLCRPSLALLTTAENIYTFCHHAGVLEAHGAITQ